MLEENLILKLKTPSMHSSSAADLLQSHKGSLCPLGISPHLELITFFPG